MQRERREDGDALMQHAIGVLERERDLSVRSLGFRRIGNAPMRRHRLTRPNRTAFASSVVTNGESKIERRSAGLGEFMPRLRAKAGRVVAKALQEPQRLRMDLSFRLTTGAVGAEFSRA